MAANLKELTRRKPRAGQQARTISITESTEQKKIKFGRIHTCESPESSIIFAQFDFNIQDLQV